MKRLQALIIFTIISLHFGACIQASESGNVSSPALNSPVASEFVFIGPRQNVPSGAPRDQGFLLFSVSVPGVVSRSGQPTITDFQWLKDHGWKGVVDLRLGSEGERTGDDRVIQGFNELGFNYLALPIPDGSVPTDQQVQRFFDFVANPLNKPVHVHCRAGVGRTGLMIALYRYAVQGWPMDKAIGESRLFRGGVNEIQRNWLERWAQEHKPKGK